MDFPNYVRIEYWNEATASWVVGHSGMNLMKPDVYIQKLGKRGIVARAVNRETGEIVYSEGADLL